MRWRKAKVEVPFKECSLLIYISRISKQQPDAIKKKMLFKPKMPQVLVVD